MWQLGQVLVQIALNDSRLSYWIQEVDVVMPAPSSLWSRMRGRFDLAATLAWSLEKSKRLPYVEPPRAVWGRWQKQALTLRKQRGKKSKICPFGLKQWDEQYVFRSLPKLDQTRHPRVLLVDDVVTTGHTLTEFTDLFRNIDFRILTLASAYRQT